MKKSAITFILCLFSGFVFSQDIIYTVSGELNKDKMILDSILVENISNNTRILFKSLPPLDYYQLNLTKKAFWGSTGINDVIYSPDFSIESNLPGILSVKYHKSIQSKARLTIYSMNGQKVFSSENLNLFPQNSVLIQLGTTGVFLVKIETSDGSYTFKAIGSAHNKNYNVEVTDGNVSKTILKSTLTPNEAPDFSFKEGDTIQISVFRDEYYAPSTTLEIEKSEPINFQFEKLIYASSVLEIAYPDSIGESIQFIAKDDTLTCKKINNEYVYQGDIILTEEQLGIDSLKGAGIPLLAGYNLWPENTIYYTIDEKLKDDSRITDAISHWEKNTTIRFVKRTNEFNYVKFEWDAKGCNSNFGMIIKKSPYIGVPQKIRIADWGETGSVIHEIGHTVGLIHEHSRSDRDKYIEVIFANVKENYKGQYNIWKNSINTDSFDFNSIMLYPSKNDFAIDIEKPTMINKSTGKPFDPQRNYLTSSDIAIVKKLYPQIKHSGTFTDSRDGHVYKTVKIGNQTWMAENLAYLPSVSPSSAGSYTNPYYYVYGYQSTSVVAAKQNANYTTYGVLYNWPAAKAACPPGWHLPTDAEWKKLEMALGMTEAQTNTSGKRGTDQGTQMKATSGWYNIGNGTNFSGFSALPGGFRDFDGDFEKIEEFGTWWSSTEYNAYAAWTRGLTYGINGVYRNTPEEELGFSVRCVRD